MRLTDDRVETMRRHVLAAVDADTRRRARRARVLGAGVAAGVLLVVGGVGAGLSGLSAPVPIGGSSAEVESLPAPDPRPEAGARAESPGTSTQPGASATVAPDLDRDVVVTGSAQVEVEDPREAAERLADWVVSRGGRVDGRVERRGGDASTATSIVRVPVDQVDATLAALDELGEVVQVDVDRTDAGTERRDLDARIDSLGISIDRLEGIVSEATSTADLLATERALQERQAELESLTSQRRALADRLELSTVTVTLSGAESPIGGSSGFVDGLRGGWEALVTTAGLLVGIAGALLPWFAVAVLGYTSWRLVRRLVRRSRTGARTPDA